MSGQDIPPQMLDDLAGHEPSEPATASPTGVPHAASAGHAAAGPVRAARVKPIEHVLARDGIELNYAEGLSEGRPPLLLLHGLAARWQVFAPLIPAFSARWHLYAPDLRGHGLSGRASPRYELQDFVDDVLALLDRRIAEPTLIYGHSIGGWLALAAAAARPDAVRAVVVGDTAIYPEGIDPDFAVSYLMNLPISMRSLAKSLNQLDPDVMAYFREGGQGLAFDPEVVLPKVACPALLLQGNPALGGLMSASDVDRALILLPQGTHVRFDGLGHGLHVEDAGAVLDVVVPFLDGL